MSVLYIFVGLISVAAVVFVLIGIGSITKYLLRTYDENADLDYNDVPNFLLGAFVLAVLSIAIGLVIALSHLLGQTIVNALA